MPRLKSRAAFKQARFNQQPRTRWNSEATAQAVAFVCCNIGAMQALPPWSQILAVALGGSAGSVLRFLVGFWFAAWFGTTFPWATLFVNVSGSLWLGWISATAMARPAAMDPVMRLLLTTGFAGGFTTFSTFVLETILLYENREMQLMWANIGCNVVLSLTAGVVGILLAMAMFR